MNFLKIKIREIKYLVIKETSQLLNYDLFFSKILKKIKVINIVRNPLDNFSSLKTGKKYYKKKMERKLFDFIFKFYF